MISHQALTEAAERILAYCHEIGHSMGQVVVAPMPENKYIIQIVTRGGVDYGEEIVEIGCLAEILKRGRLKAEMMMAAKSTKH